MRMDASLRWLAASLSYRVAARQHCLILLKNRSIKFRAIQERAEADRVDAIAFWRNVCPRCLPAGLPARLGLVLSLRDAIAGGPQGDELAAVGSGTGSSNRRFQPRSTTSAMPLVESYLFFCGPTGNSNAPKRYSSPASLAVLTSVNVASGNRRQIAKSSAVTVSQPNLNMYRPGSVTRPAFCHVILLIAAGGPNSFRSIRAASVGASIAAISERGHLRRQALAPVWTSTA